MDKKRFLKSRLLQGIGKGWLADCGPWLSFLHRGAGQGEDNGGVGLPSHSGGPPYIQVPKELPADQTNTNSKSRWAGLSPPPCPQSQRQPQPKRLTCSHNGPTQREESERTPTAGRPGARAGSECRGRPSGWEDTQRLLSLQTQALLPEAAVQDPQKAAALVPETPETLLQAQEAPQRFGQSYSLTLWAPGTSRPCPEGQREAHDTLGSHPI